MRIGIVTPTGSGARTGNQVTAQRWARLLRRLGHQVQIAAEFQGQPWQLLLALHARKSYPSIRRFHRQGQGPLVVALTGTDIYGDLPRGNERAWSSVCWADALVVLQQHAKESLPPELQSKTFVIYQSVRTQVRWNPVRRRFRVCVLGHLRAVKDPFRAVRALALLEPTLPVPIELVQVGAALGTVWARQARSFMKRFPWYRWLGEVPHHRAMRLLGSSHVMVLSSQMEGGANVVCEAVAVGTPVLGSRIGGSEGILGSQYPGYFPSGDTQALARLLHRAATEPEFLHQLHQAVKQKRPLVRPQRELRSWTQVLQWLKGHSTQGS